MTKAAPTPSPLGASASQKSARQSSILSFFGKRPVAASSASSSASVSSPSPSVEVQAVASQQSLASSASQQAVVSSASQQSLASSASQQSSQATSIAASQVAPSTAPSQLSSQPSAFSSQSRGSASRQSFPSGQPSTVSAQKRSRIIVSDDEDEDEEGAVAPTTICVAPLPTPTPNANSSRAVARPTPSPFERFAKQQRMDTDETSVEATPIAAVKRNTPGHSLQRPNTSQTSAQKETPSAMQPPLLLGDDRRKAHKEKFIAKNEAKYQFLNDIRDAQGRAPADPDYDPRTLFIPSSFWKEATPFEKQYWKIKSTRFDTVVFFKKGKFYEMFERDADIGAREFDLKMVDRAHMRMVGVPEASFEFWAAKFVAKGYKVAKVDQLETSLGKEMRESSGAKKDECIRRELTAVLTAGTLVDGAMITNDMSTACLAIKEEVVDAMTGGDGVLAGASGHGMKTTRYGVCFVDTSTAEFNVCALDGDDDGCLLETLLLQVKPREVVFEKGELSQKTMRLIKRSLPTSTSVLWNALIPGKEFWDASTAVHELTSGGYFSGSSSAWPDALDKMRHRPHVMSAVGALVWYLRSLKLDTPLVSMRKFGVYDPMRPSTSSGGNGAEAGSLVLDGQTLVNLEVFQNSADGGERGTLHALLNRCVTPYGKRMFKKWLCHPLRSVTAINARLDAVDDLNEVVGVVEEVSGVISRLPDLERLTSRIHAGACKLKDFLVVIDGFQQLASTMDKFQPHLTTFKSQRLAHLCSPQGFPYEGIRANLRALLSTFDVAKARSEGEFSVKPGVEADYDEVENKVAKLERKFDAASSSIVISAKNFIVCSHVWGYLCASQINRSAVKEIEAPARIAAKIPRDWLKRSGTKAVNRYHSPYLIQLVRKYQESLEERNTVLTSLYARTLAKFDAYYESCWAPAVQCVAEVDCLMSLARVSGVGGVLGVNRCRPVFVDDVNSSGMLDVSELRHPCVMTMAGGAASDFIPNDIQLGGDLPATVLLTGPNMGGKSTLLRQACVAIIMAQLGCYLPARACRLSVFDRIFTRIGANDNILAGQSTFMVELSESSKILHQATNKSMVILDELGRGTATFDGYAIAYAVLHHIAQRIQCCALFSTHYGLLTTEFSAPVCATPAVRLMHMACHVDANQRDVTFLYKLVPGVSPQSFGMNVASMAGVPLAIVERAEEKAKEMLVEKGWIGCVGRRTEGEVVEDRMAVDGKEVADVDPHTMSRSLLVQTDFASIGTVLADQELARATKCRQLLALWRAAKARYPVGVGAM